METEQIPSPEPSESEANRRIPWIVYGIAAAGLLFLFLTSMRSMLPTAISFAALFGLLWQFRQHTAIAAVLKVSAGLFLFYLLILLKPLLPAAIISILIVILLRDPVRRLIGLGISHRAATWSVIAIASLLLIGAFSIVVPAIVEQSRMFANMVPIYYQRITDTIITVWIPYLESISWLKSVNFDLWKEKIPTLAQKGLQQFASAGGSIAQRAGDIVNQALNLLLVPIVVMYLLFDRRSIAERVAASFPGRKSDLLLRHLQSAGTILENWLRGQMVVAAYIGIGTGIGLAIIGVNYALMMAVLTMLLAFIPYAGIAISFVLACLIGLSGSGGLAVLAKIAVVYAIVQFSEGNFVTPKIMGKAVGLNDLSTIIALAVGAQLFGLFGMVFAVPVTAIALVIIREWRNPSADTGGTEHAK